MSALPLYEAICGVSTWSPILDLEGAKPRGHLDACLYQAQRAEAECFFLVERHDVPDAVTGLPLPFLLERREEV